MTPDQPTSQTSTSSLGMTLVSGLETSGRQLVTALMCGEPGGPTPASDYGDEQTGALALGVELAEDLLRQASDGRRGNTIVELSADADPQSIGLAMEHVLAEGRGARAPTPGDDEAGLVIGPREFVTVASISDVRRLLFQEGTSLPDDTDASATLVGQLEFATVIVLTAADAHPAGVVSETCALIQQLNPTAAITTPAAATELGRRLRPIRPRLAHQLASTAGWMLRLDEHTRFPPAGGPLDCHVFNEPRPLHPERLATALGGLTPDRVGLIARSRGLFRLASRTDHVGDWSSTGSSIQLGASGLASSDPDAPVGTTIAFFGKNLRTDAIDAALHDCALTDDELIAGPTAWHGYADQFPGWE
ncbi:MULTISPECIES: GTP-binding protein [unclassified Pseudoclavibacter]|uniref:GTP-binding protein n=1 Tax=unclassified Pseudoclavibacter TaxID=2615177 RepID=UPI001BAACABA|nr:GTP-binding protein [Pseudoclavibacter sp. Marseille-Q4354]MBS3180060.1 GTP-binding protein [Pseudoclavibacter sp. Marseille-Q4354]